MATLFSDVSTIDDMLKYAKGITKKEIAHQLDKAFPFFNYSKETGLTSYHNYTKKEMLSTCLQFKVNPKN